MGHGYQFLPKDDPFGEEVDLLRHLMADGQGSGDERPWVVYFKHGLGSGKLQLLNLKHALASSL